MAARVSVSRGCVAPEAAWLSFQDPAFVESKCVQELASTRIVPERTTNGRWLCFVIAPTQDCPCIAIFFLDVVAEAKEVGCIASWRKIAISLVIQSKRVIGVNNSESTGILELSVDCLLCR